MGKPQRGYFLLADISGYTRFMAGTELEHAEEITRAFIRIIVDSLTPPLVFAEVEGDAVFVYAEKKALGRGESLLELIEHTYVSFVNRKETMRARSTCICSACKAIPMLDLKFVMHSGDFVLQDVTGKPKPVGSDINLTHRLLKNTLNTKTGWSAYALFTKQALQDLGVEPEGMQENVESYEHFLPVETLSYDLHARHAELSKERRFVLKPEEVDGSHVLDIAAPPIVVWDWANNPEKRTQWGGGGETWSSGKRPKGRTGVGATNHCAHGKEEAVENILEWKPFEYFAAEYLGSPFKIFMTYELTPVDEHTQLTWKMNIKTPLPRWLHRPVIGFVVKRLIKMDKKLDHMKELIEQETFVEKSVPV